MNKNNFILKTASQAARFLPDSFKRLLYKLPFIAKPIRRLLNASSPKGLTSIKIASGPARGMRMSLDLHAEKDYWLGTYEPDLQIAAEKLIMPGDHIYDVGANIGYISLIAARLTGESGRVYSFEALPDNITRLKKNIAMNDLFERVHINHCAITDRDEPIIFYTHASGAMGKAAGSAGRDEDYGESITVKGLTLDHFTQTENLPLPDLIKMDIEGGEGNALLGTRKMLAEKHPVFLIELHGEKAARQVWDIMSDNQYLIYTLEKGFPSVSRVDDLDWKAYIAALHKSQSELLT